MTANDVYLNLMSGGGVALVVLGMGWYAAHRAKLYERKLRHYNSLITLERQLMDIDAALHDNRIMIEQIAGGAKHGRIMMALPKQLELGDTFFNDFYVLELNQKLYAFRYNLRRINFDTENMNRIYRMLSDALMTGQITDARFVQQAGGLFEQQDELRQGVDRLQTQCIQLLGYARARMKKDRPPLMRWRSRVIQRKVKKVTNQEVKREVAKHLDDIKENQERK